MNIRISPLRFPTLVALGILGLTALVQAGDGKGEPTAAQLAQIRAQRQQMLERKRRVWFNHDGCDAYSFPEKKLKGRKATKQDLLDLRTTPLAKTHVDTLCYCTISSGFGNFTHRTKIGHILTEAPRGKNRVNITQDLLDQGTDPLQVMVDFCHENKMECFWSMRMNDTHDNAWNPQKGYPLFPKLKEEHPEYLVGSYKNKNPYGTWSSVNYAHPEIRDLCFRFIEEVCQNYDVDGVEMDFFRHLCYFKSVADGGTASQAELDMMTDLLRRIRNMSEREGIRRGRPFLIAIRVPDSADYARGLGLDIERWMAEGLVDCVIGSGYFRFNHWTDWVEMGHKHKVKVYAGLSETRIRRDRDARKSRASDASYRGRSLSAWQAGVDGIYIFNEYNARRLYLHDIGDPTTLRGKPNLYFPTIVNGSPARYLKNGNRYITRTLLSPENAISLAPGKTAQATIEIGEDFSHPLPNGKKPNVVCNLALSRFGTDDKLLVSLNGKSLPKGVKSAKGWSCTVEPSLLKPGINLVEATLEGEAASAQTHAPRKGEAWDVVYHGNALMKMPSQLPWRRLFQNSNWKEEIHDGAFYFADLSTAPDDWANLVYPWSATPDSSATAEAEVKVVSSSNPLGVCLRVANGGSVEYLALEPGKISLPFAGFSKAMDTTDAFHTYRLALFGKNIHLYVDGKLAFNGKGKFSTPANDETHWLNLRYGKREWNRCSFLFGSASGPGTGEALWKTIRLRDNTKAWNDLSFDISYPAKDKKLP